MKYSLIPNAGDGCQFPTHPEPFDAETLGRHIAGRLLAIEKQGHWRDNRGQTVPLLDVTYTIIPVPPDVEELLEAISFCEEQTGGGCSAFIHRFPNKFAAYLTDGDLSAPEDFSDPAELAVFDEQDGGAEPFVSLTFSTTKKAIEFLSAESTRDALAILGHPDITREIILYAKDSDRGELRGFAALHDKLDANLLLPNAGNVGGETWLARADAAITAFNSIVL